MTDSNNHISCGIIETDGGTREETFTPVELPKSNVTNTFRELISHLGSEWIQIDKSSVGHTGYLDIFEEVNPNGYGTDQHGRMFVQVNCLVDGKPGTVRVFERYTDEDTPLVACGNTTAADQIFGGALDEEEIVNFINLCINDLGFMQNPNKYFEPKKVTRQ